MPQIGLMMETSRFCEIVYKMIGKMMRENSIIFNMFTEAEKLDILHQDWDPVHTELLLR